MLEPHLHALPVGYLLEEYEIVRVLGAGGFGITYLAFDNKLNGPVALKEYFPAGLAARTSGRRVTVSSTENRDVFAWGLDRFNEEARALHRFRHPNVVQAHRYVEALGTAYIVMEYVEGKSLAAVLTAHGRLQPAEWRRWLDRLQDGLAHVHEHGYLHRDIKPGNIVIRAKDGEPVLINFGAARVATQERTHTRVLTPEYAPIEQHSSQAEQGPPTDIYALAAVSCRVLTGAPPPSAPDRMLDDRYESVVGRVVGADRAWLAAIDRGLALRPQDRPQTVAAWRAAGVGVTTRTATGRSGPGSILQGAGNPSFSGRGSDIFSIAGLKMLLWYVSIAGIPVGWIYTLRWTIKNLNLPGGPQLSFSGAAKDAYGYFALMVAFGVISNLDPTTWELFRGTDSVLLDLGILVAWVGLLAAQGLLYWHMYRWVCANVVATSGSHLTFVGSSWHYVGWTILHVASIFTVIGWAWVQTAFLRWLLKRTRTPHIHLGFRGSGFGLLWRAVGTTAASVLILPLPWMVAYMYGWVVENIEIYPIDIRHPVTRASMGRWIRASTMNSETSTDSKHLQSWQFLTLAGLVWATSVVFVSGGQTPVAVILLSVTIFTAVAVGIAVWRAFAAIRTHQRTVDSAGAGRAHVGGAEAGKDARPAVDQGAGVRPGNGEGVR